MQACLGLGSNQQNPIERLREALGYLDCTDGIGIVKCSSFYRTPPWGDEDQDEFINAAVQIETNLEPLVLLAGTQAIENRMGRQRSARRWGPRVIDIDLLLYGDERYSMDGLDIPHPRMHQRTFVLVPLAEIDASIVIPDRGRIGDLLRDIDCGDIQRLDDSVSPRPWM